MQSLCLKSFFAATLVAWSGFATAAEADRLPSGPDVLASSQTIFSAPSVPSGVGCTGANLLLDPSLEATDPKSFANPNWTSTSTVFGTALCDVAACGTALNTAGPRTGGFWAWLGGTAQAETTTLAQTVTMPAGGPHFLNFHLWIGAVGGDAGTTLQIRVDGTVVETINEPAVPEAAYTRRTVNLAPFANGASHNIEFRYSKPLTKAASNFSIDDVTLECTTPVSLQKFSID